MPSVLEVEDLKTYFPVRTGLLRRTVGHIHAVDGVSFSIGAGETLGLVGESGCGKSTTGRAIMQLPRPTSGSIMLEGKQLTKLAGNDMREARTRMQMIFQDPISSLNPRRKVANIVAEPLSIWKRGTKDEQKAKVT
ncbi:MAG: ATP-binding cassette domain-containing protein, partial [Burkholderiales bacterium]